MSDVDIHGLIAGYAVDGLDPQERAAVERHLPECDDCRRDLAEFRETLVRLAYAEAAQPSEELWTRISAQARRTRQAPLPPLPKADGERAAGHGGPADGDEGGNHGGDGSAAEVVRGPAHWWRRQLPWLVAAACALVAVSLGVTLLSVGRTMEESQRHHAEVEALLAAPDTHMHEGPLGDDARATAFTSYEMDALMLVVEGLPDAPQGMAYQMWYVDEDGMRSAGMLSLSSDGRYAGMAHDMGSPVQVGVSLEPEGGMPEPSERPMKFDL
ncbi:anti-sigma factor [Nocardiopsis sp. EMB25]|uniref:anti-sigma factor n=1 Tax=Nocardiopsis sp. EMB25 TaxID=2835867 RepID=UPI0022847DDD|nr:anti-sigma factor [Nocardiopsis sp. EMB25]MCY9786545.1 anti-sigma factor [Nocardiopsis sp. EMB25]